jgi:hypothetical protein
LRAGAALRRVAGGFAGGAAFTADGRAAAFGRGFAFAFGFGFGFGFVSLTGFVFTASPVATLRCIMENILQRSSIKRQNHRHIVIR